LPQFGKLAQIDEQRRRCKPKRQHRHKTLAAGDRLRLAAMRGQKRNGFGDRGRTGVIEGWKLHERSKA